MKKFIYSIAGALLFGMASCDSLNLSPEDFAAAGNYWQNAEQVGTYMNGLHSTLRSDYSSPLNLGELRGGTMREGTSSINTSLNSSSIIRNDLRTTSTGVSNWNGYYATILQLRLVCIQQHEPYNNRKQKYYGTPEYHRATGVFLKVLSAFLNCIIYDLKAFLGTDFIIFHTLVN